MIRDEIANRHFYCVLQNNYIKTSKYSVLTFLPLNLFEQFQRLANFYFLCLLVLQMIPAISSLTPITTAIPLIGVLTLTAVKDAYDDFVSVPRLAFFYSSFYTLRKRTRRLWWLRRTAKVTQIFFTKITYWKKKKTATIATNLVHKSINTGLRTNNLVVATRLLGRYNQIILDSPYFSMFKITRILDITTT